MKEVINLQGEKELIDNSIIVKTINGIHYLLNDEEKTEILNKEIEWNAKAAKEEIIFSRKAAYGTAEEQIEYAIENGWNALTERNLAIKAKFPLD